MIYEPDGQGRHAALAGRAQGRATVEYVGLVLLMAVLIAGRREGERLFSDTGSPRRSSSA
jgi:hypothetical protein